MKLVKLSELFNYFFRRIVKGGRNPADFFQLVQKENELEQVDLGLVKYSHRFQNEL